MPSLSGDIVAAIVAFAATNVDDFTVLLVFFARTHADSAQKKFGASHVVLGYVLGFTLVCGISLAGLLFSLFIPTAYLSLIAIVPILIGAIGLGLFIRKKCGHRCAAWLGIESAAEAAPAPPSAPYVSPALSEDGDPAVVVVHTGDNALMPGHEAAASAALPSPAPARAPSADADAGVARVDSTALTVAGPGVQRVHSMVADFALERKQTMHSPASSAADDSDSDDDDDDREENCLSRGFQRCCAPVMNRGVLEVIVVTLANGRFRIQLPFLPDLLVSCCTPACADALCARVALRRAGGDTIAVYLPLFVSCIAPHSFLYR